MSRRPPIEFARYGVAIVSVLLMVALRRAIDPIVGNEFPFPTLLFAVLITAWYGGVRPALLAVVLGAVACSYFLIPPRGVLLVQGASQLTGMLLFIATGVGIAFLGGSMNDRRTRAESESAQLSQRVAERNDDVARVSEQLSASEARARQMVEGVNTHAIFTLDLNGLVTSWNPGAERLYGYAAQEILGRSVSIFQAAPTLTLAELRVQLQRALDLGGASDEGKRMRKDGSEFWAAVSITPLVGDNRQVVGFVKVARDVSERVETTKLLHDKQSELQEAQRLAHVGNWYWDVATKRTVGSDEFYRIFGYDPQLHSMPEYVEQRGKRYPDSEWDRLHAAIETAVTTGVGYSLDLQAFRNGEPIWITIRAEVVRDESGEIVGLRGTLQDITEQKTRDDALRERERLLGVVTGTARVGLVVVDARYQYVFANQAYADIFGLASAEIVGRTVPDILPSAWKQIQPRLDLALGGVRVTYELTLPQVNGVEGVRYYAVVYEPRRSETGETSVVVVVVDVTERRLAEEAARESEQRLRFAQQVARIGTFERSVDVDTTVWTPELERLYGLEPTGKARTSAEIRELIHPDDRADADASLARAFTTGLPTDAEWRTTWPDGSVHWIGARFQVVAGKNGAPARLIGVNIDITEPRRAEVATREQRQRLEGIVNSAMDGIITVDEAQTIVVFNAAAERMFGCPAQEALGGSITRFLPARIREQHAEHMRRFSHTGVSARPMGRFGPISGIRSDGVEFPIDASISTVKVEGQMLYTVTCRDVTERLQSEEARKSLEAQLRQSQKMEAFGQLAGGVAHDFNNLLTVITGCSELLLQTTDLADDQTAMVSEIHGAGERAASLTRQLLAFSRQQVLELKVVDLNAVIGDIERMLQRLIGEDIALTTVLRSGIGTIKVDPRQIEQVIINLAVNARDAMPQGGRLAIETSEVELDQHFVATHPDVAPGRYVKLTMADSGSGMTDVVRTRVFEPFFTTKDIGKGTGLGLAVVHGIVKQSDGAIDVDSTVNVGTTFSIYLPAVHAPDDTLRNDVRMHMPRGSETILVVEDESGVRELAARILTKCGYRVLTAVSGDNAQQVAAEWPSTIDLMLTDVVMPGTSGLASADRLREARPGLNVLFMSGYADDALTRHGVEQAQVAFLQKPFSPSSLARKVRDTLDER